MSPAVSKTQEQNSEVHGLQGPLVAQSKQRVGFEKVMRSLNAAWAVLCLLLLTLVRAPSEMAEHRVKDASMLGCLLTGVPEPLPLQAGPYYLHP